MYRGAARPGVMVGPLYDHYFEPPGSKPTSMQSISIVKIKLFTFSFQTKVHCFSNLLNITYA